MDKHNVLKEKENLRVDKYLAMEYMVPRTYIKKLIDNGKVFLNNKKVKANYKIKENDILEVDFITESEERKIKPVKMDLDIVFEDEYLIVVNKSNGMVVHPAPGHHDDTLVNALLYHSSSLSDINGEFRPGIVHRIDKETTGLLIIAKNNQVHNLLAEMIKQKGIQRKYIAIVHKEIEEERGIIKAPIGRDPNDRKKMVVIEKNAKYAETHFDVLSRNNNYSKVKCILLTGRTHQIRVHFKYIGHPILGDSEYGLKKDDRSFGQYLHAYELTFIHPITKEKLNFKVHPPKEFQEKFEELGLN